METWDGASILIMAITNEIIPQEAFKIAHFILEIEKMVLYSASQLRKASITA